MDALVPDRADLAVLEPSAGDGAFLLGLRQSRLRASIASVVGLELDPEEVGKAEAALERTGLAGAVHETSAIEWAAATRDGFDVAVGNPPFVRFQFLRTADKLSLIVLGKRMGVSFSGVGNLWIPVFLGSLSRLRAGGVASFVVPTECLTGISAGLVRQWLVQHVDHLRLDLFPPGSFPGVLQEVLVASGKRRAEQVEAGSLEIVEHDGVGGTRSWTYEVPAGTGSWSRYLLDPSHLDALDEVRGLPVTRALGEIASIEVSIVTGANDYFSVDEATISKFELAAWAKPLLPRIRYAPGLIYKPADQRAAALSGARSWLLDFSSELPDPAAFGRPRLYLKTGEERDLHHRYKCRIRDPWYRVPSIRAGELLLSKRSHRFHRLVLNSAGSLTTDTIYRGWMRSAFRGYERSLVASFHNSLTLLSAELEGRSFGGGVLELVPSEIARLRVPLVLGLGERLQSLDELVRKSGSAESVVDATDELLIGLEVGLSRDLMETLRDARCSLLRRRLDRNSRAEAETEALAA